MTAILKEEPPEIADSGVAGPPALERLVRHCLEKRPEERFQSARDVAFDLETILTPSGRSGASPVRGTRAAASRVLRLSAAAAAIAAALALGFWLGRRSGVARTGAEPSFTRLSFGQGTVWSARFAPDGKTVVYAAAWDGQPIRLFSMQTDSTESTPLNLPDAQLLSVSSAGELAISLGHHYEGWMGTGTLARAPLRGAGARPVLEGVREADWSPDGSDLALVRRVGGIERIEFPAGKVLYEVGGWLSHIRVSPKGDRIAFAEHPLWADDIGTVNVIDLAGHRTTLTQTPRSSVRGIAWSPAGDEVWFTAAQGIEDRSLRAVDMSGRERLVLAGLTDMLLFDVSRDGRLLLGRETAMRHVEALVPGSPLPRDLSIRMGSMARGIPTNPTGAGSWPSRPGRRARSCSTRRPSWSRTSPPRTTRSACVPSTDRLRCASARATVTGSRPTGAGAVTGAAEPRRAPVRLHALAPGRPDRHVRNGAGPRPPPRLRPRPEGRSASPVHRPRRGARALLGDSRLAGRQPGGGARCPGSLERLSRGRGGAGADPGHLAPRPPPRVVGRWTRAVRDATRGAAMADPPA